jgi:hypothetical protein
MTMLSVRACLLGGMAALAATVLVAPARAGGLTIIGTPIADGYQFINFDGPTPNGGGTTINGISNNGTVVGFTTDSATGNLLNFTATPSTSTAATLLTPPLGTAAMALGINSAGTVVGFDGTVNAFSLPMGGTPVNIIASANTPAMAFGINDHGTVVGQLTNGSGTPGFILNNGSVTLVNAPTGSNQDIVNAQGINDKGLVVGFYVGNDGNQHGFTANASSASMGMVTGTAVMDPTIPHTPGEPVGTTFVFSQILGINDSGIAVGYYGDSTLSQHGYFYNTNTGKYTFLDDPSAAFNNGVEVTQITGITNSGEISGFYTDANGLMHGFIAFSVPEPTSLALFGVGITTALGFASFNKRRTRVKSRA